MRFYCPHDGCKRYWSGLSSPVLDPLDGCEEAGWQIREDGSVLCPEHGQEGCVEDE